MKSTKEKQDITIYQSNDGQISFNVNVFDETVWLSQKQMSELFGKSIKTISEHISNIFQERELEENSVIRNFRNTASDGKTYDVIHYNLDVIISVGYRVKSQKGTQFRRWATKILKQYMVHGYAINETRIKQIESSVDELVASNKLIKEDVDGIKNLLLKLIERPIVIHNHNNNQISLTNKKLEDKIIELIDRLIKETKPQSKIKDELEEVKLDVKKSPKDEKIRNNLIKFFKRLGDQNSDLYKTIKGTGIAKKVISELVRLGEKLKDLVL